jgi:hypothetical protein
LLDTRVTESLDRGSDRNPFRRRDSRSAYNAEVITDATWLPGDVLVRYPSRESSPNRRHNHVAVFAGADRSGTRWMIESRAPHGVRALPVDSSASEGGVRRFLPNPCAAFPGQGAALHLARAVPKLGRLGARLTSNCVSPPRHRGVDIYFETAVELVSPLTGSVVFYRTGGARPYHTAFITGASGEEIVILRPVEAWAPSDSTVRVGDDIGVALAITPHGCNVIPPLRPYSRLHVEYWSMATHPFVEERGLQLPVTGSMRAYNPIYAMKTNVLGLPLRDTEVRRSMSLPLKCHQECPAALNATRRR